MRVILSTTQVKPVELQEMRRACLLFVLSMGAEMCPHEAHRGAEDRAVTLDAVPIVGFLNPDSDSGLQVYMSSPISVSELVAQAGFSIDFAIDSDAHTADTDPLDALLAASSQTSFLDFCSLNYTLL